MKGVSESDQRLRSRDSQIHSQEGEHLRRAGNFPFKPVSLIQVQAPLGENLCYQWMKDWRRAKQEARQRLTSTNINSSSRFISAPDSKPPNSHTARPTPSWEPPVPNATRSRTQVDGALRSTSRWRYKTIPLCPQTQSVVQRRVPRFPRHVTSDWPSLLSVKLRDSFLHHMSNEPQALRMKKRRRKTSEISHKRQNWKFVFHWKRLTILRMFQRKVWSSHRDSEKFRSLLTVLFLTLQLLHCRYWRHQIERQVLC